ncbi:MAG TPA: alpha/beta fold hydrolase [Steroidobacteraceae bacterium]|nr:alpha/beta fold hydrolase [Steroidobacteraceae bacterium]
MPAAGPEPLTIDGPSGALEALLEDPRTAAHAVPPSAEPAAGAEAGTEAGAAGGASAPATAEFAVVCHPHPLHGGTLQNKVVYTLARVFVELGLPTLRFNYRGVGASAGRYDQGVGETDDTLAVIAYARRRWPGAVVSLAGFSFGAMVALRAAPRAAPVRRLVCVAPAVGRISGPAPVRPECPWLIVQGDADEIVDPRQVAAFAAGFSPAPQLRSLAGVDHFFHGRLRELHDAVLEFSSGQAR